MNHVRTLLFGAVLFTTGWAAGTPPPPSLSLEECVQQALRSHPSLSMVKAQLTAADANKEAALAALYPKITWTNTVSGQQASFGSASALFAAAPRGSVNPSFFSTWVFGTSLGLQQTVFPWDRALDAARGLDAVVNSLRAQEEQTREELRFQVISAYTGALLADQAAKIAEEGLALAQESQDTTQGLFKEGRASALEVEKAKVQRLDAEASREEAKSRSGLAREALQLLVGAPAPFELSGTLDTTLVRGDAADWEAQALVHRPESRKAKDQLAAAKAGAAVAEKAGWPTVGISASYSWLNDQPGFDTSQWYKTWGIGVNVSLPLFDGWAAEHQTEAANAQVAQMKAVARLTDLQIKLEIRQAWNQLSSARNRLSVRQEQVKVAEDNWRTISDRYKLGLVSWLEVKDVELALTSAKIQLAQTQRDYVVGQAALERAAGVAVPPLNAKALGATPEQKQAEAGHRQGGERTP